MTNAPAPITSLDEARAALDAEITALAELLAGRDAAMHHGGTHPWQRPAFEAEDASAQRQLATLRAMRARMDTAP